MMQSWKSTAGRSSGESPLTILTEDDEGLPRIILDNVRHTFCLFANEEGMTKLERSFTKSTFHEQRFKASRCSGRYPNEFFVLKVISRSSPVNFAVVPGVVTGS